MSHGQVGARVNFATNKNNIFLRRNFVTEEDGRRQSGATRTIARDRPQPRKTKVAPKDRQRLANVIACKNVIKDQSMPVKQLLRPRDTLYLKKRNTPLSIFSLVLHRCLHSRILYTVYDSSNRKLRFSRNS